MTLIGIEIGATKIQAAAGDRSGHVETLERRDVDPAAGAGGIRSAIEEMITALCRERTVEAVGIGFGGPVNIDSGVVALSYQISGWPGFNLLDWMGGFTGAPVIADNDANAAALAEARLGAGAASRSVFYTNLGSGMGGGMVIDGRIYHGARPGESELGLASMDMEGHTFESRCCGWAVDRRVKEYATRHPDSALASRVQGMQKGQARVLTQALEAGDAGAQEIIEETAACVAFALSQPSHLFHPEVLVVGGGLSLIGEPLRRAIADRLPSFMTTALKPGPPVRLAALGEKVVCVGGLLMAADMLETKEKDK